MTKKACIYFTSILLFVTCSACGVNTPYYVRDYLHDLALETGLSESGKLQDEIRSLTDWGVINEDETDPDEALTYEFLFDSLGRLLSAEDPEAYFRDKGLLKGKYRQDAQVGADKAQELIKEAVKVINNQEFSPWISYEYKQDINQNADTYEAGDLIIEDGSYKIITYADENGYESCDAAFEEIFSSFEIADTYEVDFSQAEVIPYGNENTVYQNEYYELLASRKNAFEINGFKISYTLNGSNIDIRAINNIKGVDIFADLCISNVRPSFRWTY
ncbi:MAG: hypothetical protein IKS69_02565, partial [Erysipelotrichaceae bacterium]|nr:hypothetical protein [Erysipelotrichaceae bacterium]